VVTGSEKLLPGRRPHGKGKTTDQVIEAIDAPTLPCVQQKGGICQDFGLSEAELADQIGTIIEADIGDEAGRTIGCPYWLKVVGIFWKQAQQSAAQKNSILGAKG
jgi:hypothetical protein